MSVLDVPFNQSKILLRRSNTAVIFGTSLEAQGLLSTEDPIDVTTTTYIHGRGWFNWCKMFLGQRLDMLHNSGVSGNTSTQMLARVQADVVGYNPGWVFIGGPVNDATSSIGAATTIANMTAIYQALAGRMIVQFNLAPRTNYNTTQLRQDVSDVNEWFRNVHTLFPNVIVVDVWRLLAQNSTGSPATGMSVDGTHYTESAAARIGQAVANTIAPLIQGHPKRLLGLLDPRNVLGNPDFSSSGSGWSILIATATTTTYPADDETWGNQAKFVIAGSVGNDGQHGVRYLENMSNGRFAVGDVLQASARIRWTGLVPYTSAVFSCRPWMEFRLRRADSSYAVDTYGIFTPSSDYQIAAGFPASGDVVIKSGKVTVPSGASAVDRLYLDLGWVGATDGTFTISEVSVSRLA